jgi:hypothetical protein
MFEPDFDLEFDSPTHKALSSIWDLLEIHLKPEWGSKNLNHREAIRAHLQKNHGGSCENLNALPKPESGFCSISHTHDLGGYIKAPYPIGLDIEASTRSLSAAVQRRLGGPKELKMCPKPLALWVAKEAAYKALMNAQLAEPVISSIQTQNWRESAANIYEFSFLSNNISSLYAVALGRVSVSERTTLGFAALLP